MIVAFFKTEGYKKEKGKQHMEIKKDKKKREILAKQGRDSFQKILRKKRWL